MGFKIRKKIYTKKIILDYTKVKLRDYQIEASEKSLEHDKGIYEFPTGTGKSLIEFDIIYKHILKEKENDGNGKGVFLLNSPRILLSYQLIDESFKYITSKYEDAIFLLVHSGDQLKQDYLEFKNEVQKLKKKKMYNTKILTTTNSQVIQEQILLANRLNLPIIICSTYHSMEKVQNAINHQYTNAGRIPKDMIKLNLIINDEAHYLTEKRFFDSYRRMKADKNFFVTATKKTTESSKNGKMGISMDNDTVFGKTISYMSNKVAVDRGLITPLRIVVVNADKEYIESDYEKSIPNIIKKCFDHLNTNTGCGKLLVAVRGVGDIMNFFKSNEYKKLLNDGVDIFSVASNDNVGNNINGSNKHNIKNPKTLLERTKNGQPINRYDFLKELKKVGNDPKRRMVVLHYDILTEGVDTNGFNGYLPMRTMCKTKTKQNVGRCVRRDPNDIKLLNKGTISPYDFDSLNKPYAHVYLTNVILGDDDKNHKLLEVIQEMRYSNIPIEEIFVHDDTSNGTSESDDSDKLGQHYVNKIKTLNYKNENIKDLVLTNKEFLYDVYSPFINKI